MVPNIDFLPESYRRKRQTRQKKAWRRTALMAVLTLIVCGGVERYQTLHRMRQRRDTLQGRARHMQAQLEAAAPLQLQIQQMDARADLLTRLQLRIAPTRLLTAVAGALPDSVHLTEYHSLVETASGNNRSARTSQPAEDETTPGGLPALQQDVTQLKETQAAQRPTVYLHGRASDDVVLAQFLAGLEQTGCFGNVQLLFSDPVTFDGQPLRSFSIRLQVHPPKSLLKRSQSARLQAGR